MSNSVDKNIFDYAIKQILNKNYTLVLGAGVSKDAKGLGKNPHYTENMKSTLLKEMGIASGEENKKSLSGLCQEYFWDNKQDYKILVEKLKIEQFCKLKPTKAHYYIAFLVREGLISEIITTNYDCCMEKAYLIILDSGYDLQKTNKPDSPVFRIFDNKTFSKYASKKYFNDLNDSYCLKVYKINGCSYAVSNDDADYDTILLTKTQLQNWRKRQWAADFFRYKLRSTSLFFSGFGSDEPQVIHTIQTVFEENDDISNNAQRDQNNNDIFNLPNSPIISVFKNKPSFVHNYIAKQFCIHNGIDIKEADKLIINKETLDEETDENKTFPADELWERIYKGILKRLIKKALMYASKPSNASFTAFIPYAKEHLTSLEKEVGKVDFFFNDKTQNGDEIPFSNIIYMLNILMSSEKSKYIPVSFNKELVAELIFIMYLLFDKRNTLEINKFGNMLEIRKKEGNKSFYFTANSIEINEINEVRRDDTFPKHLSVLLIGKNNFRYKAKRYLIRTEKKYAINICQLNLSDIFNYYDQGIKSLEDVRKTLKSALAKPSKFIAESRASIGKRLKEYQKEE